MTIYYVNTGTSANSGNGDSLRVAFNKINHNFAQVSNELSAIESGTTSTLTAGTYTFALSTSGAVTLNGQPFVSGGSTATSTGTIWQLTSGTQVLSLGKNGTLNTPLLLPKTFIATLVPVYGFAPGYNPPGPTGGNAWQYEVHFVVSQDGSTVETQINAPVWPSNPGYKSGDSWTFTEADHGIPGYSFTLILSNVTYPGPAGWTANLEVSPGPDYPSTVQSLGAIKLSSNNASWIFGTDSKLILPQLVGRPTSITLVTGHPMVGYTTGTYGTYVANGSPGTGMTVDVLETDGYNITSIAINQLGHGYTQGQHVYIDGGTGTGEFTVDSVSNQASTIASFGDINLTASTSTWAFNNDGNLQLPTGGSVYFTYGGIRQTDFNSDLFVSSGRGVKIGTDEDSQQWTFSTGGSLTFPSGAQIIADSQDGTYLQANPGIDGYAGLSSLTGNSWMWTANDGGAYISSSDGATVKSWSFNTDGKLTLPIGGDIVDNNGTSVLNNGVSITDFGVGFVNTLDSGKITTSKLYNKNPNQGLNNQYELSVDNGGVVHLPDQSIINGATLKSVPGNYAGITAGPVGKDEDSWVWVDNDGAWIATKFSTTAYTWHFDNTGKLTLPTNGTISYAPDDTDNWNVPAVNTISAALDELALRLKAVENIEIEGGNAYTLAGPELILDGNGA